MPRRKKSTVNRQLVDALGVKRALYVEVFIMSWAMWRAANGGDDPRALDEFAADIGKSTAQIYRWRADFREAFPQWSDPGQLLDAANVDRKRAVTVRDVARLEVA